MTEKLVELFEEDGKFDDRGPCAPHRARACIEASACFSKNIARRPARRCSRLLRRHCIGGPEARHHRHRRGAYHRQGDADPNLLKRFGGADEPLDKLTFRGGFGADVAVAPFRRLVVAYSRRRRQVPSGHFRFGRLVDRRTRPTTARNHPASRMLASARCSIVKACRSAVFATAIPNR